MIRGNYRMSLEKSVCVCVSLRLYLLYNCQYQEGYEEEASRKSERINTKKLTPKGKTRGRSVKCGSCCPHIKGMAQGHECTTTMELLHNESRSQHPAFPQRLNITKRSLNRCQQLLECCPLSLPPSQNVSRKTSAKFQVVIILHILRKKWLLYEKSFKFKSLRSCSIGILTHLLPQFLLMVSSLFLEGGPSRENWGD